MTALVGRDNPDRDDLVHDTYLVLYEKVRAREVDDRNVAALAKTICRGLVRNYRRSQRRRVVQSSEPETAPSHGPTPEAAAAISELLARAELLVATLSDNDRIVLLGFLDSEPVEETLQRLGSHWNANWLYGRRHIVGKRVAASLNE